MIPVKELKRVRDAYIEKYLMPRMEKEETPVEEPVSE
jgi:V/A-type H+-transporting ATPase subunit B